MKSSESNPVPSFLSPSWDPFVPRAYLNPSITWNQKPYNLTIRWNLIFDHWSVWSVCSAWFVWSGFDRVWTTCKLNSLTTSNYVAVCWDWYLKKMGDVICEGCHNIVLHWKFFHLSICSSLLMDNWSWSYFLSFSFQFGKLSFFFEGLISTNFQSNCFKFSRLRYWISQ